VRRALRDLPAAEVVFVFLGQVGAVTATSRFFTSAEETVLENVGVGPTESSSGARSYLFDVTAIVADGRLEVTWGYSANLHRRETVEALAAAFVDALADLVRHCRRREEGLYSPSHFTQATLNQDELDELVSSLSLPED
jgi:non-ribosomal peptide synthase protein (TIGR01720 family)